MRARPADEKENEKTKEQLNGPLSRHALFGLVDCLDAPDLPEEQSMNGQTKKAHRLIRELQKQIYALQHQIERLASNHPYPKSEESECQ